VTSAVLTPRLEDMIEEEKTYTSRTTIIKKNYQKQFKSSYTKRSSVDNSDVTSRVNSVKLRQYATVRNFSEPRKMLGLKSIKNSTQYYRGTRNRQTVTTGKKRTNSSSGARKKSCGNLKSQKKPFEFTQTNSPSLLLSTSNTKLATCIQTPSEINLNSHLGRLISSGGVKEGAAVAVRVLDD